MTKCFFVSDLHGHTDRYIKLFDEVEKEKPAVVFIGGDILPSGFGTLKAIEISHKEFINGFLLSGFQELKKSLGEHYPRIFLILGNDDGKFQEGAVLGAVSQGIWDYVHNRRANIGKYSVYGYSYVPPTPFKLKDWERYDVSRYVDPGCISPEDGYFTVSVSKSELKYSTIKEDLEKLVNADNVSNSIFLFHSPPYQTTLDRAAYDGISIDNVPLDKNVGSIAIRKFIEDRQPLLTLHGHVHESVRITGKWHDKIGRTLCYSAAHDGPELAIVKFNLEKPEIAVRELI